MYEIERYEIPKKLSLMIMGLLICSLYERL